MTGELVLITGVSGHVGFRTLVATLGAGYHVRAIVRKSEQSDSIKAAKSVQPFLANLEIVILLDLLKEGAFDNILKDAMYILHIASPLPFQTENPENDIIEPAVKGTLNILSAAQKTASVKRIVITSSLSLLIGNRLDLTKVHTELDLVPRPSPPYGKFSTAYRNSKILAYYATMDWIEANKPRFDIVNLFPSFIIGPNELNSIAKQMGNGSNIFVMRPLLGIRNTENPAHFATVHVDDVAAAHVKTLNPNVKGGQSFLLSVPSQDGAWDDALKIVRHSFPIIARRGLMPLNGTQPSLKISLNPLKAEKELGIIFKSYEEQVKDLVGQYVKLAGP
ncbi:hypothetical protein B7463_g6806, partial [Scytalidium lignicola]